MSASVDELYGNYHLNLLEDFVTRVKTQPPFATPDSDNETSASEEDLHFLHSLMALPAQVKAADFLLQGQDLLCRVVSAYPHLMPLLHRDLLWFFGGDCLHYMPDEEIRLFQILDEKRQQAQESGDNFSYPQERAKMLGLH